MANKCAVCFKKAQIGRQSRHHRGVAGKQWMKRAQKTVRVFKPNIQWASVDGIRIKVCTKCMKLIKKGRVERETKGTSKKTEKAVVASAL